MLLIEDPIQMIMVSYFRPNDTMSCLNAILKNTDEPFKLAIIDNSVGGLDDVLNKINDPRITIYRNERNFGKARGFMKWYPEIIKNNKNEFMISLDADVSPPRGWLSHMLRAAYLVKEPAVLAPVLTSVEGDTFDRQLTQDALIMHRKTKESRFVAPNLYQNRHLAGPLLLISRSFFDKNGGYIKNQLYGNEDGDLCRKAAKQKKFTGIVTNTVVLHLNNDADQGYKEWKIANIRNSKNQKGYWD